MEMEVEEKADTDLTTVGTEMWTDRPGGETSETRQNQTFACDQTEDSASARVAGPGDAVAAGDGSDLDRGEEGVRSGSECDEAERNNTTSVIVSVQKSSEAAGDAAVVCSTEEGKGDNESVTTTTAEHPGKVIVTDVTINSLTVTFKEAKMAEGFFKGY